MATSGFGTRLLAAQDDDGLLSYEVVSGGTEDPRSATGVQTGAQTLVFIPLLVTTTNVTGLRSSRPPPSATNSGSPKMKR